MFWRKVFIACFLAQIAYDYAIADALRIGNSTINLFSTKVDVLHAIGIKDHNSRVYYINMVPVNIENSLHIDFDNEIYSSCEIINDYCVANGKLYWAHPSLYLQSGNTQYVNLNYVPTLNTSIEVVMADKSNLLTYDLIGVKNGLLATTNSGFGISMSNGKFGFFRNGQSVQAINKDSAFHYFYLSNTDAVIDDTHYNFSSANEPINISRPMFAFGFNHLGISYNKPIAIKFIKIYENDILVRHWVPVPKNLVIGSYTVPSNGMFDIVEQRFYSNAGSGNFTYGKDTN